MIAEILEGSQVMLWGVEEEGEEEKEEWGEEGEEYRGGRRRESERWRGATVVLMVVTFDGGRGGGGGVADGKNEEEEKKEESGEGEGKEVECIRLEFDERGEVKAAKTGESCGEDEIKVDAKEGERSEKREKFELEEVFSLSGAEVEFDIVFWKEGE